MKHATSFKHTVPTAAMRGGHGHYALVMLVLVLVRMIFRLFTAV